MRPDAPLVLNVLEVLESPGTRKTVELTAPAGPGLASGLAKVDPSDELGLELTLEAIEGGLYVKGTISGRYRAECRRCLAPVGQSFTYAASELYRPPGDVWEEGYGITSEGTIDLGPLVRDTVLLNMPADPVCREDCKGLCPSCGANLNEGPCPCPEAEADPRWTALRELGDQLR